MNEKIESIINQHCEELRKIDKTQSIAKIVRLIETQTQVAYAEIYAIRDGRKNGTYDAMASKHGHCC